PPPRALPYPTLFRSPKPITGRPAALSALAVASTARVAEGWIAPTRFEMRPCAEACWSDRGLVAGLLASSVVTPPSWQSSTPAARATRWWTGRRRRGEVRAGGVVCVSRTCDLVPVDSHDVAGACMLIAGQNRRPSAERAVMAS